MKRLLMILVIASMALCANAQSTSKKFDLKDFDKIQIENINGKVDIELGKKFNIEVDGKTTLFEQISITKNGDKLIISINKKYISDWRNRANAIIKISMPEVSKLYNNSNADVSIVSFTGRYFGAENNGNGNLTLKGSVVDLLDIENNGNGDADTKNIVAKKVSVIKTGNGSVTIKTNQNFEAKMSGNGDVINFGTGKAIISKQSGNGKVIYKN